MFVFICFSCHSSTRWDALDIEIWQNRLINFDEASHDKIQYSFIYCSFSVPLFVCISVVVCRCWYEKNQNTANPVICCISEWFWHIFICVAKNTDKANPLRQQFSSNSTCSVLFSLRSNLYSIYTFIVKFTRGRLAHSHLLTHSVSQGECFRSPGLTDLYWRFKVRCY